MGNECLVLCYFERANSATLWSKTESASTECAVARGHLSKVYHIARRWNFCLVHPWNVGRAKLYTCFTSTQHHFFAAFAIDNHALLKSSARQLALKRNAHSRCRKTTCFLHDKVLENHFKCLFLNYILDMGIRFDHGSFNLPEPNRKGA